MTEKINEFIDELELMDIDELDQFREDLIRDMKQKEIPEFIIDCFSYIVDRVIVTKSEIHG